MKSIDKTIDWSRFMKLAPPEVQAAAAKRIPEGTAIDGAAIKLLADDFKKGTERDFLIRLGQRLTPAAVTEDPAPQAPRARKGGRPMAVAIAAYSEPKGLAAVDYTKSVQPTELKGSIGKVLSMAMSPDGSRILQAAGGSWWLLDKAGSEVVGPIRVGGRLISHVAFSPSGKEVAIQCADGMLHIFKAATGEKITGGKVPQAGPLAYAPDGYTLSSGAVSLDARSLAPVATSWGTDQKFDRVAYSPDGRYFAATVRQFVGSKLEVWDLRTGEQVTLEAPVAVEPIYFGALAFSPDGKTLAFSYNAQNVNHLIIWDMENSRRMQDKTTFGLTPDVMFSSNGKQLFLSGSRELTIYDATDFKELNKLDVQHADNLALSSDGRRLAAHLNESTKVWEFGAEAGS